MKIYFAGSIRGGRADKELYLQLIQHLQKHGNVLSEHIGDTKLTETGEKQLSDEEIFKRDIGWLNEADIMVAEVTQPSLGVGYELFIAQAVGKKILCLHRPQEGRRLSAMISGNTGLNIRQYTEPSQAFDIIDKFISETISA